MSFSAATTSCLERLAQASLPLLVQLAAEKPELAGPLADAVAADLTAAATPAAATSFHSSGAAAAPAVPAVSASFSAYCNVPDVSCTVPRGKHDIEFSERSIVFRPKSGAAGSATLEVPRHTVSGVFHLVTKEHQHLLLSLSEPVTIGKAQHSVLAVCESAEALRKAAAAGAKKNASGAGFSVPLLREVAGEQLKDAAALAAVTRADRAALEGDSSVAVLKALAGSLVGRVGETDLALFKSARGNSFVRCYVGVNDGMLFPLRRAFVFVGKPLLVLPHADVAKAQVERGGGASGTTFDMSIQMQAPAAGGSGKGSLHTFSMVPKEELDRIRGYVGTRAFGAGSSGVAAAGSGSATLAAASSSSAAAAAGASGDAIAAVLAAPAASEGAAGVPAGSAAESAGAAAPAPDAAAAPAAAVASGGRNMNEIESEEESSGEEEEDGDFDEEEGDDDEDDSEEESGSESGSEDDDEDEGGDSDEDDEEEGGGRSKPKASKRPKQQKPKKRRAAAGSDDEGGDGSEDDGVVMEGDVEADELKALLAEAGMDAEAAKASTTRASRRATRAAAYSSSSSSGVGSKRGREGDEAEGGGGAKRGRAASDDDLFDEEV